MIWTMNIIKKWPEIYCEIKIYYFAGQLSLAVFLLLSLLWNSLSDLKIMMNPPSTIVGCRNESPDFYFTVFKNRICSD